MRSALPLSLINRLFFSVFLASAGLASFEVAARVAHPQELKWLPVGMDTLPVAESMPMSGSTPALALPKTSQQEVASSGRQEIVFLDQGVAGYETLARGVGHGAELVLLDRHAPALTQIADALAGRSGVDAIHIVSHGAPGALAFAAGGVDGGNLSAYAHDLRRIGATLSDGGDVLIYGCDVGADGDGQAFLDALAAASDADVAASDDPTGAADLGGDWVLESSVGTIDDNGVAATLGTSGFTGLLATPTAGTTTYGTTTVVLGNQTATSDGSGNAAVNYFDISVVGHSGSGNTLIALYRDGDSDTNAITGPGEAALGFVGNATNSFTGFSLTSDDGSEFSLTSFDYAYAFTIGGSLTTVTFTGSRDGSDVGTLVVSNPAADTALSATFGTPTTGSFDNIDTLTASFNTGLAGTFGIDDFTIAAPVTNTAPDVTTTAGSASFTEGAGATPVDNAMTVVDPDGDNITGATVQITGNYENGADLLAVTDNFGITSSFAAASGTLTLTGAATATQYQSVLRTLTFDNTSDAPSTATRTVTYAVTDAGTGTAGTATRNITVTAVNDDPTIAGLPATVSFTEDTAGNLDLSAATFADPDAGGGNVTLTLAATGGTLSASSGGGVTIGGSGTATLTLSATVANINAYLNTASNIQYTPASNATGTPASTLSLTANDGGNTGSGGGGNVALGSVNLNVSAANDPPTASGLPASVTVIEDTQSNIDLSAAAIADVDSAAITVTFTANAGIFATPADGAGVGGGVTETLVNSTTITLVGAPADINTYLDTASNIQYTAAADVNGNAAATMAVVANDGDGSGDVSLGTVNIDVTAVNDPPAFAGLDGMPAYTEGGAPVALDSNASVSDVELDALNGGNGDYSGASLTLVRNGGANVNDNLSVPTGGNLTVAGGPNGGGTISSGGNVFAIIANTGNGQLQLSFADNGTTPTTALVNEVLQAIRYSNNSNSPAASVQLNYTVSDGADTDNGSVTVSITNVNDAPSLTATGQNPSYIEGAGAVDLFSGVSADVIEAADRFDALTLTVTNVSDGASELLTFDGSDVALTDASSVNTATNGLTVNVSVTGTTATVAFSGAVLSNAQMQTLVDGLAYRNTSDNPTTVGNRVVTITGISDNGGTANGGSNSAAPNVTSTVSLTGVNDPPVVGNLYTETSQVVAANGAQALTGFADATVSSVDSIDYNGGFITLAQTSGTANGNWFVDGTTVTSGGDATVAAGETLQVMGLSIGTVDATDDGQGGNDFTIDFNGGSSDTAVETLLRNLTFEAPSGLGDRGFTLTLNDADGTANSGDEDASGSFTISVTPNPPVIANLDGDSVRVALSTGTAVDAGSGATVTDADSVNFDGGNITINRTTALPGDFALSNTATAGGDNAIAGGETIAVGGTNIGLVTSDGQGTNALVIDFNSTDATPGRVQSLVRSLVYQSAVSGVHTFDLTITDAATMPATSLVNSFSVDVNAAPVVVAPSVPDIAEDAAAQALPADVQLSDANGDSQDVSLTASGGSIALGVVAGLSFSDADGSDGSLAFSGALAAVNAALDSLTFTPASNTTGAASLTVSTVDALGDGDSAAANFTLLDQQPAIADASFGVAPTATPGTPVGSVVTTGDQTGLSYSISAGNTGSAFAIDGAGAITVADTAALSNLPFTLTIAVDDEDGDVTANDTATVTVTDDALPVLQAFARQTPTEATTNADSLVFRVTFDEDVQNVDAADFVAVGTTASIAGVAVATANSVYDVTVSGGDLAGLNGSVSLNLSGAQDITDTAGNALPAGEPGTDETYTLDNTAPSLTSIVRQSPADETTNADALTFRVSFDGDVQNVDAADFAVNGTTTATATNLVAVTADSVFDVTLSGGDLAGFDGVVGLDLAAGQNISDAAGNALPTAEPATDETYTLDNAGPELSSIVRQNPTDETTSADTLTFRATFDMDVQNVDGSDFVATGTTATITNITTVTADTVFDLTVSGGDLADLNATVGLDLAAGQDIVDGVGNPLPTTEPATDETYTLDNTAPEVTIDSLTTADTTPALSGTVDDNTASLELTVNGQTVTPTNNGDGTWTLADDVLTALPLGTYDVAVTATDEVGNEGSDTTSDELTITTDTDGDGVADDIEDGAPNGGDGNNDGIRDAEQSDVTTLATSTGRGLMTLEVTGACSVLEQVRAIDVASYPDDPSERVYPFGLVEFSLPCETATVDVIYHDAGASEFTSAIYRKYGPTTPGDTATAQWYDFSAFATVSGNRWTLDLADNRLGDDTGDDGIILDQGGPSVPGAPPAVIPVNKPWALILLLLTMLALGRHALLAAGQRG